MKVLFDSNVIIDALSSREGASNHARDLLLAVAQKRIQGYLCSKQITDIHYVLRKYYKEDNEKRQLIRTLLSIFTILPLGKEELDTALSSSQKDFEDGVLTEIVKKYKLDGIVTNNQRDFFNVPIVVWTPEKLSQETF